jgi:hypothetical protein
MKREHVGPSVAAQALLARQVGCQHGEQGVARGLVCQLDTSRSITCIILSNIII